MLNNWQILLRLNIHLMKYVLQKNKTSFSYENTDETLQNSTQNFRAQYFKIILDSAIVSMSKRFNRNSNFIKHFGLLYDVSKLKTMPDEDVRKNCQDL